MSAERRIAAVVYVAACELPDQETDGCDELSERVAPFVQDGWQPFGAASIAGGPGGVSFVQTLVKYEEHDSEPDITSEAPALVTA